MTPTKRYTYFATEKVSSDKARVINILTDHDPDNGYLARA